MILLSEGFAGHRRVKFLPLGGPLSMILLGWPVVSGAAHARKVT